MGLARVAAAVEFPPVLMAGGRGPAFRLGFRSGVWVREQWEARGDKERVGNLILAFGVSATARSRAIRVGRGASALSAYHQ